MSVELPRWDLSDLYASHEDPQIEQDLARLHLDSKDFQRRFKGRVLDLPPRSLQEALAEAENYAERLSKLSHYALLLYYGDTQNAAHQLLHEHLQAETNAIHEQLQFLEHELKRMPADRFAPLLEAPELANYRTHLERLRALAAHTLSEAEERVCALKELTGSRAWAQLYTELSATMRIQMVGNGEIKRLTVTETKALRSDPDRALRREASQSLLQAHADRHLLFTTIFNSLYLAHAEDLKLRHHSRAIAPTLLADDLPEGIVEALLTATEANYDLVHDYYKIKAKALDIQPFASYDTLAPYTQVVRPIPFQEAQELVLKTFAQLGPEQAAIAERLFASNRIDAPPAPGKRGGSFCAGIMPQHSPYILLNYQERLEDVTTLAHELGHGLHYLLSGGQSMYNYEASTPLSEIASTLMEVMVVDQMLESESDRALQRQLLAKRLEDAIQLIFRQVMYTRWELRAHARRAEGIVSAEDYCAIWSEENARLYGPDVQMTELDRWGWLTIPHLVHYRFYCYSYAFGLLMAYALHQQLQEEGKAFLPKMLRVLQAGRSKPPVELLRQVGVDLADLGFWQKGIARLRAMLPAFEAALSSP